MPDWSYQTVVRPLLRRLPFEQAQWLALSPLGMLGRSLPGRLLIRLLGHAEPDPGLRATCGELTLKSPVALAAGVDADVRATAALSLFGFGLIEVGPAGLHGPRDASALPRSRWDTPGSSIHCSMAVPRFAVRELIDRLPSRRDRSGVMYCVRLADGVLTDNNAVSAVAGQLAGFADAVSFAAPCGGGMMIDWKATECIAGAIHDAAPRLIVFVIIPRDAAPTMPDEFIAQVGPGNTHFLLARSDREPPDTDRLAQIIASLRARLPAPRIIGTIGGVRQPADALEYHRAGCDLIVVRDGFIESGPGLPKRVNQAIAAGLPCHPAAEGQRQFPAQYSWFWSMLLAVALLVGGVVAVVLGTTHVLLPYDEEYLGMVRDEVCGISPRLLPFMRHDRVTLAGTMLALGLLYLTFSVYGDRRGRHWAHVALVVSAFAGFLSFFLFLGFGYFDPFHAFITLVLFQFLTLTVRSHASPQRDRSFDLINSRAWHRALWGQLLVLIQGAALITAGIVICVFGVTSVFVADDLVFLQTSPRLLSEANDRLIPLIAHDRASFGGMLLSTGLAVTLAALWGWERGRHWLWWSLAVAGSVGYLTTLWIHLAVGYTAARHLLPAWLGLGELWVALALSKAWMFDRSRAGTPEPQ